MGRVLYAVGARTPLRLVSVAGGKESGAHLHIAHVTTAKELEFFGKDE